MSITVYTKPFCPQCTATQRALKKHGIPYDIVDLTLDSDAADFVKGLGYSSAPVVFVDDKNSWSGFRPDRIEELKQLV